MKNIIKKILSFIFNPKYEKLILIFLPAIVVIISAIIISPAINIIASNTNLSIDEESNSNAKPISSNIPKSNDDPIPTVNHTSNIIHSNIETHLTAISTENDLYIFVRNNDNKPITNDTFSLNIKYPDGQVGKFKTSSDGGCYLINLSSGTYTISMDNKMGYSTPDEISCSVKDKISYSAIENIEDIVEVKDVSEIVNEVKSNTSEAPTEIIAEIINSSSNTNNNGSIILDDNGNALYTYQYSLSPDGFFYDSAGNVTDVKPQLENDILIGGLKKISDYEYQSINIFNQDNTPIATYAISCTPKRNETSSTYGWQTINNNIYYILSDGSKAAGLKNIDGKTYYFDCNGVKASSLGVDVSFYNGTINWPAVKNAGIDFAIIRIGGRGWGTGALYDDSCFYNYLKGAKSAGLKVGVYFYSAATNRVEAVQEASIAIERLNGVSLDLPIYIDMELSGDYPNGRTDNLSVAERVEIIQAFCETIKNSNYKSGVYTGEYFLSNYLNYQYISQYNIWMASYTDNNDLPKFNNRYDVWQFTDRGRINGINGNADLNVIF